MLGTLLNFSKRSQADSLLQNSPGLFGLDDKIGCLEKINRPDVSLEDGRFIVFDSETTGLYSGRGDEIISLGAMVIEEGGFTGSCFFQLVNPNRKIPRLATEITGITENMVKNAPDVLSVLDNFLGFSGRNMLLGHCVQFDLGFINAKLKKYCNSTLNVPALDTMTISQLLFPDRRDYTLDSLARSYGISLLGRHTALGDCQITAQLFFALVEDLAKRGIFTASQLLNQVAAFRPVSNHYHFFL